jgi:hypothetical protein
LLLTEEAPCEDSRLCPRLSDEVADKTLEVEVALSVISVAVVEVAVVEAVTASVATVGVGVELAVSARLFAGSASVDVTLVDVAVRAATKLVLKAQTVRLVRRTLAIENAITLFFIPI